MLIVLVCLGKTINLTSDNMAIISTNFNVDKYGNMTLGGTEENPALVVTDGDDSIYISPQGIQEEYYGYGGNGQVASMSKGGFGTSVYVSGGGVAETLSISGGEDPLISIHKWNGSSFDSQSTYIQNNKVTTPQVVQTSLESIKKNIKQSNINALDIIKDARIYQYNLKSEEDKDKKHIGFIIGDKYETPKEVLSQDGQGIDMYTMSSIMWKAIQEQQKIIEELQAKIKEMESDKK